MRRNEQPDDRSEFFSRVETWFVRQGLPHAIHDYSASTDVLTRAAPFLSFVFLAEATASFGDRFAGWAQFGVLVLAIGLLLGAVAMLNTLRGRRRFELPEDVGVLEILLFIVGPALLPVLFSGDRTSGFLLLIGFNILVLAVTYFIVSFGMIPMLRSGAVHMVREVSGVGRLMMRSLPLLLLFATFLFLNAEMWQVAHDFTGPFYAIAVGIVALTALVFLALRIPAETSSLAGFSSWHEVCEVARGCDAPIEADRHRDLVEPPAIKPLKAVDRLNIGVLLFMRQAVQVVLVAVVIGVFYVVFGLFTVREETIVNWTALTAETFDESVVWKTDVFGSAVALTWELLAVSGFIAAFSALQFAVSLITDSTYRDEFFADAAGDVRNVLAVRALYLADIEAADESTLDAA